MTDNSISVAEINDTETQAVTATDTAEGTVLTEVPAEGGTEGGTEGAAEAKPAEQTGPSEEEIKAAVDGFEALLDAVLLDDVGGERNTQTGHISDDLRDKIKAAFTALPVGSTKTSARPRVKALVEQRLDQAMEHMDMPAARTLYTIQNECLVARRGPEPSIARQPVDPTETFVEEQVARYMAPYLAPVPDGVADDWPQRVEARHAELIDAARSYATWFDADEETRGDEPEVADAAKQAVRLSRGRATRAGRRAKSTGESAAATPRAAYAGPKRNVANHIAEAFADKPVGTWMSIQEIAKFPSKEYAGDKASPGAVSARIHAAGGCTIPGIAPQAGPNGKKGAVKTA